MPLNGLSATPMSTPKKLLFQTPPCTSKIEKTQNKLLAPNTQHRTQRRKVTDSPTIIPDTPDRNSDAENDWGDISVHRIPATQSQEKVLHKENRPFNFSYSVSETYSPLSSFNQSNERSLLGTNLPT